MVSATLARAVRQRRAPCRRASAAWLRSSDCRAAAGSVTQAAAARRPLSLRVAARAGAPRLKEQCGDGRRDCCSVTDGATDGQDDRAAASHATQKPELEPSALPLSRVSSGADRAASGGLATCAFPQIQASVSAGPGHPSLSKAGGPPDHPDRDDCFTTASIASTAPVRTMPMATKSCHAPRGGAEITR